MSSETDQAAAMLRVTFGASVRELRKKLGLSQRGLGRLHNLSQNLLSGIELGTKNLRMTTMVAVATAVGGDVPTMLTRKNTVPGGSR